MLNLVNEINPIDQLSGHEKTSKRYNFVNTRNIISQFEEKGWKIRNQSLAKSKKYQGFQKHVVRMYNDDFTVGDYALDILITNQHHGSHSVVLQVGIYRFVCANGLVVGTSFITEKIRHCGFTYEKLQKSMDNILLQMPKIKEIVCKMKEKQLTLSEAIEFANKISQKRLEKVDNVRHIDALRALKPQREEDNSLDLFTVLNVVQERAIRGGIKYTTQKDITDNNGIIETKVKTMTSRKVRGITRQNELNSFIFDEAYRLVA